LTSGPLGPDPHPRARNLQLVALAIGTLTLAGAVLASRGLLHQASPPGRGVAPRCIPCAAHAATDAAHPSRAPEHRP